MAATLDSTVANIKPLAGATVRRFTAGASIVAGNPVSMMADGFVDPSDASAFTGIQCVGVALASVSSGETVDVVVHGPVKSITGGTPAAAVYVSDTGGAYSESAGTKDAIIGFVEAATIVFVRPRLIDLS